MKEESDFRQSTYDVFALRKTGTVKQCSEKDVSLHKLLSSSKNGFFT
jgi:hypothetical protein